MTDLLQIVPYLLGFHPAESAVAVLLRGGQVLLTARSDLGPSVVRLTSQLTQVARAHHADGVVLVAYTPSPLVAWQTLQPLVDDNRLPRVVDAVHVDRDRWWSLLHDTGPGGEPLDAGRLAAEAVFAGLSAVPNRSQAVAAAERPPPQRLTELTADTERQLAHVSALASAQRVDDAVRLVRAWIAAHGSVDAATGLTTPELIRLGVLVRHVDARDAMIMLMDADNADALVACWSAVVAVTEDRHQPGSLCLLGLAAWVSGSGALLVRCIERADGCDPDYSLARLLARIADQAVPPSAWARLMEDLVPPATQPTVRGQPTH